jgi:hypothetical protein
MPKFIRKDKIILVDNLNEENKIEVSITIDSNHVNSQLDQLLMLLSNNVNSTLLNYKVKVEEVKEKPKAKPKAKKNVFSNGSFV